MYPVIRLKKGREKSLLRHHPWVFSGAVHSPRDKAKAGELVFVESYDGLPLGTGYFNPESDIRVRMLDFKQREINQAFFEKRIQSAHAVRKEFYGNYSDAYRLTNSEGDFLPGLIVDRYGLGLVVSVETLGIEALKPLWLGALKAVNLGDDADTTGAIYGQLAGAFYGVEGIPQCWREKLTLREKIEAMADGLRDACAI